MKLLIVALLVAVAAASFPPAILQQVAKARDAAHKLFGVPVTPDGACGAKFLQWALDHMQDASAFDGCQGNMDAGFQDPASVERFCDGTCFTIIDSFLAILDSPECAGNGAAFGFDGDIMAGFKSMKTLMCMKVDGELCMPKMMRLDGINPFQSSLAANETILAETLCHPCMQAVLTATQQFRMNGDQEAALNVGGMAKFMCQKTADNHFCFSSVKALQSDLMALEQLTAADSTWETKWLAVKTQVCDPNSCFRKFFYGFVGQADLPDDALTPVKRAMDRLDAMCTKDLTQAFCIDKIVASWKAHSLANCHSFPLNFGPGTADNLLNCSLTCPVADVKAFFDDIGCCAGTFHLGVGAGLRDAIDTFTSRCGFSITADPCVARKTGVQIAKYVFNNLRNDYATTNQADVIKRIKQDISAALQIDMADLTVQLGALPASGVDTMATTSSGTTATTTANCNADTCAAAQSNSNTVQFNKVNSLGSTAAVDPSQPTGSSKSAASTVVLSFAALLFALFVALF